jgi:hypothetical protein
MTSRGMNFSSFEFHDRGVKKNKRTLLKERRKCETMTTITMLKPDLEIHNHHASESSIVPSSSSSLFDSFSQNGPKSIVESSFIYKQTLQQTITNTFYL